jgi:hypothetical protein
MQNALCYSLLKILTYHRRAFISPYVGSTFATVKNTNQAKHVERFKSFSPEYLNEKKQHNATENQKQIILMA